ncbi:periplasmic high pH-inducible lipid-binding protein [Escherichia coli]|nr:periplasmic high pH-inducible lipid-binding protein [Escherichia coli]GDW39233.1 periplasmic high pH-inducible lipid-binding protein [Escherichia coli]CTY75216.1 Uncharacterised protein [Escherichia coli]CTZ07316.1 Uncharacterised protein [Escherichia coli]CTZ65904.1 Uncharacterised protein [Escherichia coli]
MRVESCIAKDKISKMRCTGNSGHYHLFFF